MRVAVDAMGNDRGPMPIVEGVGAYLRHDSDTTVLLVGDRPQLVNASRTRVWARPRGSRSCTLRR